MSARKEEKVIKANNYVLRLFGTDITKFSYHFKETQTEHCRQYFNGYHMPISMEKAIALT